MRAARALLALFLALMMLSPLLIMLPGNVSATALAGYSYRVQIDVNALAGGAQTAYVMKLSIIKGSGSNSAGVIYLNNQALNWPNDIRFTASDGTTLLDFWRQESDATDGTWLVELSTISATTTVTYYLYYGKTSDTDASSGANTFLFFDDFPGTSYDTDKWTEGSYQTIAVANSRMTMTSTAASWGTFDADTTYGPGTCMEYYVVSFTNVATAAGLNIGYNGGGNVVQVQHQASSMQVANPTSEAAGLANSQNTSCVYHIGYLTNKGKFASGSTSWNQLTTYVPTASIKLSVSMKSGGGVPAVVLDWVSVRKLVDVEPTWATPGAETFMGLPVAAFSGTPLSGMVGLNVTFTDASTNTPTAWYWDFGDGSTSTAQNPYHVYSTAGTYTVKLNASNAGGYDWENKTGYIIVNAKWACSFTSSPVLTGTATILYSYHITLNATGTVTYLGSPSWLSISSSKNGTTGPWYLEGTPPSTGGTFSIKLQAYTSVGLLYSWGNYTLSVNATPSITSTPALSIPQFDDYSYLATADQPGTWYLLSNATWLVPDEPYINGTPGIGSVGSYWVMVEITNANGTTYGNFTLTVGNTAPTITSSPVLDGYVGFFYRYDADASEPVTWVITCSYPNIDVDSSGVVSGFLSTGDLNMSGDSITVHLAATDLNGDVAYQNFTIITGGPQDKVIPIALALFPIIIAIILIGVFSESAYLKRKLR